MNLTAIKLSKEIFQTHGENSVKKVPKLLECYKILSMSYVIILAFAELYLLIK